METIAILKKIIIQNLISSWTFCNWDCYKQPIFFPLHLFSVFSSTERTDHCFAKGQQCLSPDLAQLAGCSVRLGWALVSDPARGCKPAAAELHSTGSSEQARKDAERKWLGSSKVSVTGAAVTPNNSEKRANKHKNPGGINSAFL